MASVEQRINTHINRALKEIERNELGAIREALALLNAVRREIIGLISEGGSEFNVARLRGVQRAIEYRLSQFEYEAARMLQARIQGSANLGIKLADAPMVGLNIPAPLFALASEDVLAAASFTPDLIKGISHQIRDSIGGILRRIVLGGLTVQEGIASVGRSLESPGVFRSVATRAEVIVRTEVLRIQSIANQKRQEQNREVVRSVGYSYQKAWLSAQDKRVREAHRETNGQVREIDEPFDVGNELLMFPRDPAGSPDNTIQCRCVSIPVLKRAA